MIQNNMQEHIKRIGEKYSLNTEGITYITSE